MLKISLPQHFGIKCYECRNIEKVCKNHVPTCPVFAGPVTYTITILLLPVQLLATAAIYCYFSCHVSLALCTVKTNSSCEHHLLLKVTTNVFTAFPLHNSLYIFCAKFHCHCLEHYCGRKPLIKFCCLLADIIIQLLNTCCTIRIS